MNAVQSDTAFMKKVETILDCGFQLEESKYFGPLVVQTELDSGPNRFSLMDQSSGGERAMEIVDRNEGVVAIQLDELTATDLTIKGNRMGKRWYIWKVIDLKERIMTIPLEAGWKWDTRNTIPFCDVPLVVVAASKVQTRTCMRPRIKDYGCS